MKKTLYWIVGGLIAFSTFLLGFLIRQPQINKLKKQVELLQKDNSKLITLIENKQAEFKELLVQHKALKALQHRKKAATKELIAENLVMQYAIREYLSLLLKRVKYDQELTKEEILFFDSFEKVIDGKKLSTADKVKIRDHIMTQYPAEIKKLMPCEYAEVLDELDPPKYLFCAVRTDKAVKYYLVDDDTLQVGDYVYIPAGKSNMTAAEVVTIKKYREKDAPVPIKTAQRIIRKLDEGELDLPAGAVPVPKKTWVQSWREGAKKENPAKRKFMEDTLSMYLKDHPEEGA